jgi:hypothetical protein
MMAKMFYTLDEAKSALGKSEDEIKQYSKEGRLREFRDGTRLMYKADQVEQLKNELAGGGGSDQVDLGTSDSGGLIGLVDTTGASGTSITLSDTDTGQSSRSGSRVIQPKDDTALAADLGLSGTMGGVPSPGRVAASGTGLSGTATGRTGGINVFGGEEPETVDPSAQTAISGAVREQMNLEGVGSGSGLLDLTRESDDTSLGAVLDEISPGGRSAASGIPSDHISDEPAPRSARPAPPEMVVAADPMAPAFAWMSAGGSIVILFGIYYMICDLVGTTPIDWFAKPQSGIPGWAIAAIVSLVLCVICFGIGAIFFKPTRA